jgi:hypothetical protein
MHVLSIVAALALALSIGFATAHNTHQPGKSPIMTPFDGGGDNGGGSGGSINGGGPPG